MSEDIENVLSVLNEKYDGVSKELEYRKNNMIGLDELKSLASDPDNHEKILKDYISTCELGAQARELFYCINLIKNRLL